MKFPFSLVFVSVAVTELNEVNLNFTKMLNYMPFKNNIIKNQGKMINLE